MNETTYTLRRNKLLASIEEGVIILSSAPVKTRSNDTEFPYRQNSDFYYLCGFEESNTLLVLVKTEDTVKSLLFLEAHDEEHALWNGARMGLEKGREHFDVDEVADIAEYPNRIPELLRDHTALYIDLHDESPYAIQAQQAGKELCNMRGVKRHIRAYFDVTTFIRKERLIKTNEEIAVIRKAIELTAKAHHEAMKTCKPGMVEYQLQASMSYVFLFHGARFEAYGAIVAGGNNANTLHYVDNRDVLRDGELVLIDAACEWELYASDITRTFPINGKFTAPQREV
ncbi:MAG TPA: aminopeptidase P N-terminal domain-containing protein, partial [Sulfuricurvum sp.]|nr:aminopeptidase P N-terminal domain-containing protein [Sulfuricurvum sp.]